MMMHDFSRSIEKNDTAPLENLLQIIEPIDKIMIAAYEIEGMDDRSKKQQFLFDIRNFGFYQIAGDNDDIALNFVDVCNKPLQFWVGAFFSDMQIA